MFGPRPRFGGVAVILVVLLGVLTGIVAYNAGVSHGLAQQVVAQGGQAVQPPLPYPYVYPYAWYRPWGFGFGFPIFFLLLLWFVAARALFWRRQWHHGYYAGWRTAPPVFEEWHRQAHERTKEQPSADDPGRRG